MPTPRPGRSRRLLPLAAAAACVATWTPWRVALAADEHRVALAWDAPDGCPSGEGVAAAVDALLRGSGSAAAPLPASASVAKEGEGFVVRLGVQGGSRTIHGGTCRAVADAVAVVLALAVDPDALSRSPSPSATTALAAPPPPTSPPPASPPPTSPPPTPPPAAPTRPASAARPAPRASGAREAPRLALEASASVETGPLPAADLRLEGGAGLGLGAIRVSGLLAWGPDTRVLVGSGGAGADVGHWEAALLACGDLLHPRPFTLAYCVGGEAGALHASSFGVSDPGSARETWLAGRFGSSLGLALTPRVEARLLAALVVPAHRPELVIVGRGRIGQPEALGARLGLGLSLSP